MDTQVNELKKNRKSDVQYDAFAFCPYSVNIYAN